MLAVMHQHPRSCDPVACSSPPDEGLKLLAKRKPFVGKQRWGVRVLILTLTVTLVVLFPPSAAASAPSQQSAAPLQMDVRVGFDGYVQSGAWTPIVITASNSGEDLSAEVRVEGASLAGAQTVYVRPLDLPRNSRKQVTLYASDAVDFSGAVRVELVQGGRVLLSQQVPAEMIAPTTLLIGLWSDSPQALMDLATLQPSSGQTRLALLTAADLPDVAAGWQALDVLVISDADTGVLTPAQRAALRDWIAGGGRLIVTGGPNYARTVAGLGDVLPLQPDGVRDVSLAPLADAVGIPFGAQAAPDASVASGSLFPDAHVLVAAGEAPLVAWRRMGHGRVDFLTADPYLAPLVGWAGLGHLWTLILSAGHPRPAWAYGFAQWGMAWQAIAAVPGVSLPSVLQLCGFLALYVVLVGPLNYWVLTRLKRRELAWFTIPALILLFSLVAYVTGFQLRGARAIVHRLALVQTWGDSDTAQVHTLVGIWSPRRARYDVLFDPGYLIRPLPPDFGMALAAPAPSRVEQGEAFTLRGVQVDVGAVQSFAVEGFTHSAPRLIGALTLAPQGGDMVVHGEVVNASDLDLHDAALVIAGTATPLGDLPAGAVLPLDQRISGGMAALAPGSPLDPYPSDAASAYYYPGMIYYDVSLNTVIGGDCYSTPALQRRCNLLSSLLSGQSRGAGAYVTGWADSVPLGMQVLNAPVDVVDAALIIAALEVQVIAADQPFRVPPGLTVWQPLDATNPYLTPYDLYLYAGEYAAFRYAPSALMPPLASDSFVVHLEGSGQLPPPLVEVREVATGQWQPLTVNWGETTVTQAAPYVDALGGVALRLSVPQGSANPFGYSITRLDVTFYGQP